MTRLESQREDEVGIGVLSGSQIQVRELNGVLSERRSDRDIVDRRVQVLADEQMERREDRRSIVHRSESERDQLACHDVIRNTLLLTNSSDVDDYLTVEVGRRNDFRCGVPDPIQNKLRIQIRDDNVGVNNL